MLELLYSASSCTNVPRFGSAAHYELRGWEPCGQPRVQGTDLSPGAAVMRPGPATSPSGWPGESLPRYSVTSAEEAASVCGCVGGSRGGSVDERVASAIRHTQPKDSACASVPVTALTEATAPPSRRSSLPSCCAWGWESSTKWLCCLRRAVSPSWKGVYCFEQDRQVWTV